MSAALKKSNETQVNVVFMYNSCAFDAYEVLGLQAGASIEQVLNAFNDAKKNSEPDSHEFLREALNAIRIKDSE